MGMKGPKAYPNAIKAILGRKEQGKATSRKGMGTTPMKKYGYNKKM
tara:strand:+ start:4568 stop:4705 length:138 start_codon:yes stop_codon:yes gene_type:complete